MSEQMSLPEKVAREGWAAMRAEVERLQAENERLREWANNHPCRMCDSSTFQTEHYLGLNHHGQ